MMQEMLFYREENHKIINVRKQPEKSMLGFAGDACPLGIKPSYHETMDVWDLQRWKGKSISNHKYNKKRLRKKKEQFPVVKDLYKRRILPGRWCFFPPECRWEAPQRWNLGKWLRCLKRKQVPDCSHCNLEREREVWSMGVLI